ncbi:hypothetical protein HW260_08610 [Helicobacter cinaedi]|uniref:Uncharacterized protein n=1 Tax=Helicobacter cinaedi CCUG 18818 = ATCC BAA-847 TaxID=537971 RepID=A0AAI8ML79_9HELI|nr:hypothetical protein [Helicobacter cinaedi]AWK61124.1 hypothetical protein C6B36_01280 [Helicobacter cinaedi]EFR47347.1 hypothetical protein HCCG_01895 [Helicobacter cinaedi CCUG 18818 = ATCC BAA-847]QOQ90297.1 hypothetical protein HW260_08610 [Helicobacter cinaedi]QOQ96468.1 hypothetical protein HW245_01975 [Helicobacter cinaedi]BAM31540.1 hypothetical protein HCBAA847_0290 [Helicobacter cinaedi CCUG 18818 = ATCC BAA-847]
MADTNKTKDSHRKHSDFMNPYDEYNNEATHHFDIATKQWITSGDFYKTRWLNALLKRIYNAMIRL